MLFYHYTSEPHLEKIMEEGVIKVGESNISPTEEHFGPDVVWLFKQPLKGKTPKMLISSIDVKMGILSLDKSKMEIAVDLPVHEVRRADKFFKQHGAKDDWIKQLEISGTSKSKTWYVIERDIVESEWVNVSVRPNATDVLQDYGTNKVQKIGHVEGTYVFGKS